MVCLTGGILGRRVPLVSAQEFPFNGSDYEWIEIHDHRKSNSSVMAGQAVTKKQGKWSARHEVECYQQKSCSETSCQGIAMPPPSIPSMFTLKCISTLWRESSAIFRSNPSALSRGDLELQTRQKRLRLQIKRFWGIRNKILRWHLIVCSIDIIFQDKQFNSALESWQRELLLYRLIASLNNGCFGFSQLGWFVRRFLCIKWIRWSTTHTNSTKRQWPTINQKVEHTVLNAFDTFRKTSMSFGTDISTNHQEVTVWVTNIYWPIVALNYGVCLEW